MEYSIGENVIYGANGVCRISGIEKISFFHERPKKYYILEPLFVTQSQTTYVPYDDETMTSKIQPIVSKEEALALIDKIPQNKIDWIEDRNERKDAFGQIILNCDRAQIMALIRTISHKRDELESAGKKLNMQDERILIEAQKRINGEFAVVLNMNPDEISDFVSERLSAT